MTLGERLSYLELIPAAARGDIAAIRRMASTAFDEAQLDQGERLEALTAAELWGRFAAAIGDEADIRRLATVLGLRSAVDREMGRYGRASIYDEDVAALAGPLTPDRQAFNDLIAAALRGDEGAHQALFVHATDAISQNDCDYAEGLVVMEAVARIGATWGHSRMRGALAGVLCYQIEHDERTGRVAGLAARKGELIALLSTMASSGIPDMVAIARTVLPELPGVIGAEAIKAAALQDPTLLNILPNEGNC